MRVSFTAVPAAVALLAAPLAAQSPSLGLIGGITSSKVALTGDGATLTFDSRIGFAGGASLRFPMGSALELEIDALYAQKGFKVNTAGVEGEMKLGYVEVPVLLTYGFGTPGAATRPFLLAGGSAGFKAGCDISGTDEGSTITADCNQFIDAEQNGVDLGFTWGAGGRHNRLTAQIRYTMGMTEVFKDEESSINNRNRTLYLLAGFAF